MGAPKGNKNGYGRKGRSGRKSAYEEIAKARDAQKDFDEEIDVAALSEKVKSGKRSMRDMMKLKGASGETPIITKMMEKVYATPVHQDLNITASFEKTKDIGNLMVKAAELLKIPPPSKK